MSRWQRRWRAFSYSHAPRPAAAPPERNITLRQTGDIALDAVT
jgi:hypothetical protein